MIPVNSWGRLDCSSHNVSIISSPENAYRIISAPGGGLAYGNGRSYGDVCLNPGGNLWCTKDLNHFIDWDPETGILHCEAGILVQDVQRIMLARGWILPVTPGTQHITIGGAIANDIHGKNHHAFGSFGDHVKRLWLARTDGELIECSPHQNSQWFAATVGGIGLTGVIIRAELQLRRINGPWLNTETIPFGNLQDFFCLSDESEKTWEHTVAWVDCLRVGSNARGIFMRANPSIDHTRSMPQIGKVRGMPFTPPISLINNVTLRPLNTLYYWLQRARAGKSVRHFESFLYPLDRVQDWNRGYGPKGFYQYQSVVPRKNGLDATREMLNEISRSGEGSFLAVLKTFGQRHGLGMLSFPRHGVTLALDFPNRGATTLRLFERLDKIVLAAGGALYLAKDIRMSSQMFEAGYPRLAEFTLLRDRGISSAMSRRLLGS